MPASAADRVVEAWIEEVIARHTGAFTRTEFLKAVRALSARYVERRADLPDRSPTDSPGKRAAFAAFFAPLHLLTVRAAVRALNADRVRVDTLLDLGCGTGVASAAWASALETPVAITGVDLQAWSLTEALWNWRTLGLRGRTKRIDMLDAVVRSSDVRGRSPASGQAIILGWSANELDRAIRRRLLPALMALVDRGAALLVVEPLSHAAVPWWAEWAVPVVAAGGRADEWKFDVALPAALKELDEAAGFRREALGARTLWVERAGFKLELRSQRPEVIRAPYSWLLASNF